MTGYDSFALIGPNSAAQLTVAVIPSASCASTYSFRWEQLHQQSGCVESTACDALGNPTGLHLTPGQDHDLEGADALWSDLLENIQAFLADKTYDAQKRVLDLLAKAGVQCVIPPKKNRKEPRAYDEEMDKARHLIENFFAKLKPFRAIATRYDKRAQTFLATVYLAASLIWLNRRHALDVRSHK